MSLLKPDHVDLVTLLPGAPARVALIAYDGGEISDAEAREKALQKKLIAYLQFVVSGQFATAYPQFLDREPCIRVVCAHPPTEKMKDIDGIRDPAHPETLLSVEVTTDAAFREVLRRAPKST
jgi:hypothetical protein